MELVRSADKPFEWGVNKAAELGYEFDQAARSIQHLRGLL